MSTTVDISAQAALATLGRMGLTTEELARVTPYLDAPLELHSVNPSNGETLAIVRSSSLEQTGRAIACATERFASWRNRPAPERGMLVRRLGELLREHKESLGALITMEVGKVPSEGLGEVQEMIDICDFAVGLSRQLYGKVIASERPHHRLIEQWHPLGPVGIITAFNFPAAVWAWNAAIALVCGNTCIWKPSPRTPLVSLAIQHLANIAMTESDAKGVMSLVLGGAEVAQAICEDRRAALISFTGATASGRAVSTRVAGRLGRTLLELGGNNAIIVLDDARVDLALRAIVFGTAGTAGQRCTSTRRLFVQKGIAPELTQKLVKAFQSVRIGPADEDGVLMGPLINRAAVQRFHHAVKAATEAGGEVLCGGKEADTITVRTKGFFVEPTLIRAPAQDAFPIAWEETFAPILYMFEVDSLSDAIAAHNDVDQGLSGAIFTESLRSSEAFLSAAGADCGIANVNVGTSGAEIGGAFGGEKDSGGGRESGSDAWKGYMRRQTCTINWGEDLPLAQGVKFDL